MCIPFYGYNRDFIRLGSNTRWREASVDRQGELAKARQSPGDALSGSVQANSIPSRSVKIYGKAPSKKIAALF